MFSRQAVCRQSAWQASYALKTLKPERIALRMAESSRLVTDEEQPGAGCGKDNGAPSAKAYLFVRRFCFSVCSEFQTLLCVKYHGEEISQNAPHDPNNEYQAKNHGCPFGNRR